MNKVQEKVNSSGIKQYMEIVNNFISSMERKQQANQNTEITRFNSQFELYKGEEVKVENVLELLKVGCENLKEYKVNGNQIRLYIENGKDNTAKLEEIKSKINNKWTYIVSLGYDDSGCIQTVTLIPNEKN